MYCKSGSRSAPTPKKRKLSSTAKIAAEGKSQTQGTLLHYFGTKHACAEDAENNFVEDDMAELADLPGNACGLTISAAATLPSPPLEEIEQENESGENAPNDQDTSWIFRTPYYQRVFEEAVNEVMENERYLLNDDEQQIVSQYFCLTANTQRLFVRLFSRECKWIRIQSLSYKEIDIPDAFDELSRNELGFADTGSESLSELLQIISGAELKALMKESQIVQKPDAKSTKARCVATIIEHTMNQKLLLGDPIDRMRSRVKGILGPILRLKQRIVDLFEQIMVIFFRSFDLMERPMTAGILSEVQRWAFPQYTIGRSQIFESREMCIQYFQALKLHAEIERLMEQKKWAEAVSSLDGIRARWEDCVERATGTDSKQYFLLQFTPGRIYTTLLTNYALHILPPLRQYTIATAILHLLLSQHTYGRGSRGKWWDQLSHLTLNYAEDTAAGREDAALEFCIQAVQDPYVRAGWLVKIRRRMERVGKKVWARIANDNGSPAPRKKSKGIKAKMVALMSGWEQIIPSDVRQRLVNLTVKEPTEVLVEGEKVTGVTGIKSKWLVEEEQEDLLAGNDTPIVSEAPVLSTVEVLALSHYAKEGYAGLHLENTLFHHIFALLFHTILFTPHPDVFQTRFQTHPLDFFTDDFYLGRESLLKARCDEIESWTINDLVTEIMASDARLRERKIRATGLGWDSMEPETLEQMVNCMNPHALAEVMKCMAEGYREHCGGLPDLVLWRPAEQQIKLVEVKGPGDRLSEKQIMWMDILAAAGWDVEVCRVVARKENTKAKRSSKSKGKRVTL